MQPKKKKQLYKKKKKNRPRSIYIKRRGLKEGQSKNGKRIDRYTHISADC